MDLANAARAPKPGQHRRTHAPGANELTNARCGAKLATVVVNDGDVDLTTCTACRAVLHKAGLLPYQRQPR